MLAVTGGLWEGFEAGGPELSLQPLLSCQLEKQRAPVTSERMFGRPSIWGEGGWGHEAGSEVYPRWKKKTAVRLGSASLEMLVNDTEFLWGH